MLRKKKNKGYNKSIDALDRALGKLAERDKRPMLSEHLQAIVCEDGIILIDMDPKGYGICLLRDYQTLDFKLGLTEAEMQEFNGGIGLRDRYFPYKEELNAKS